LHEVIYGNVLIFFQNGTREITKEGIKIRPFSRNDFLAYQPSFAYDEAATYEKMATFLDEILPEKDKNGNVIDEGRSRQKVLAEYIAYIFTVLKLEKTLILFGTSANDKSVFFEVIYALLEKKTFQIIALNHLAISITGRCLSINFLITRLKSQIAFQRKNSNN
jgi:putative DNA primase/helicase